MPMMGADDQPAWGPNRPRQGAPPTGGLRRATAPPPCIWCAGDLQRSRVRRGGGRYLASNLQGARRVHAELRAIGGQGDEPPSRRENVLADREAVRPTSRAAEGEGTARVRRLRQRLCARRELSCRDLRACTGCLQTCGPGHRAWVRQAAVLVPSWAGCGQVRVLGRRHYARSCSRLAAGAAPASVADYNAIRPLP